MTTTSLKIAPLGERFGVQILELDLSQEPTAATEKALNRAILEHQLLLFRRQQLSEDAHARVAKIFGRALTTRQADHYPSKNPFTHYLSNVDRNGNMTGTHPDPDSCFWHTDGSWSNAPYRATVLHAIETPPGAGGTEFANMYLAYAELDRIQQEYLGILQAEHDYYLSRAVRRGRLPWQWLRAHPDTGELLDHLRWWAAALKQRQCGGVTVHPVVRIHPETGRRTLFLGDHAWRVTGHFLPTGMRLMKQLKDTAYRRLVTFTHHWEPGDVLIWDNSALLHRALSYKTTAHRRILRRSVIAAC
jgi:taurine dioxygenase